jgi:hypothetical protein
MALHDDVSLAAGVACSERTVTFFHRSKYYTSQQLPQTLVCVCVCPAIPYAIFQPRGLYFDPPSNMRVRWQQTHSSPHRYYF